MDPAAAGWRERFAPQLLLDPSRKLDRLLVAQVGAVLEDIPASALVPPLADKSRRSYEHAALNFRRWCAHVELADSPEEVAQLPPALLRVAVEMWLEWRISPVDPGHPLTDASARERGERRGGWRQARPHGNVACLRSALAWWAATEGLNDNVFTAQALALSNSRGRRLPARTLTDDELVSVVLAYKGESVLELGDCLRTTAWHRRQLAALNMALATSLRPTAEMPLLTDGSIVGVGPEGVAVRLARTKRHPEGRVVHLLPRDDLLCPVWALVEWLTLCRDHGWDRRGVLLPAVHHARYREPLFQPSEAYVMKIPWMATLDALGLSEAQDARLPTPHGLRSAAITRAAEAGWEPLQLMRLGGWESLDVAMGYAQTAGSAALVDAMARDLVP